MDQSFAHTAFFTNAPHIVTLAKGLGGGYQPLGAVVAWQRLHERIVERFGSFAHGHTYVGHPTACAAGAAVASVIERDDLLANVLKMGALLSERLRSAFADRPEVGDVRGRNGRHTLDADGSIAADNAALVAQFTATLRQSKRQRATADEVRNEFIGERS